LEKDAGISVIVGKNPPGRCLKKSPGVGQAAMRGRSRREDRRDEELKTDDVDSISSPQAMPERASPKSRGKRWTEKVATRKK